MLQCHGFRVLRRARPVWRRPSLPSFTAAPLSTLQRADSAYSLTKDDEEENAQFARVHAQWLRLSTTFDADQVKRLSHMLAATGARSRAEVGEFVHERDLIAAGASLVDSRRLLMGAAIPPSQTSTMMRPQAALKEAAEAGLARGQRGSGVIFTSSVLGGMMLSFGGAMYVVMGGGNPLMAELVPGLHRIASAAVFPVGLSMVVFTGTDLLTSNMMYHTLPFLTHQHRNVSLSVASRVWSLSFAGNFVGSVAIAAAASAYLFTGDPYVTWLANVANAKVSMAMPEAFVRAVGANWLVNVAIFMALSSRSAIGKLGSSVVCVCLFCVSPFVVVIPHRYATCTLLSPTLSGTVDSHHHLRVPRPRALRCQHVSHPTRTSFRRGRGEH